MFYFVLCLCNCHWVHKNNPLHLAYQMASAASLLLLQSPQGRITPSCEKGSSLPLAFLSSSAPSGTARLRDVESWIQTAVSTSVPFHIMQNAPPPGQPVSSQAFGNPGTQSVLILSGLPSPAALLLPSQYMSCPNPCPVMLPLRVNRLFLSDFTYVCFLFLALLAFPDIYTVAAQWILCQHYLLL